jgi:hypothetical protein
MPAPSCPHDSMQSTVGGQGRMLCERYALGRHAEGPGGFGQMYWPPRPRAPAHVAIRMLGHPYAQEPALLARFTREARAAAGLSHPNIVAGLRQRLPRRACTIWSWRAWKRNPRRPHQHRGVARVQPARRQGRRAGRRTRQGPRQAGPAGGRRLPPGRGARRPRRRLTCLPDVRPQLVSGPPSFATPSLEPFRWLTRFHGWTARTQHPLELLASQMRRAVAEAAKS